VEKNSLLSLILLIINKLIGKNSDETEARNEEETIVQEVLKTGQEIRQEDATKVYEEKRQEKELLNLVTLNELLKGSKLESIPVEHQANIKELHKRINLIREAYGKPMVVTSGYRSKEDHTRIYKELAVKRNVQFDENKIPWGSQHLKGAAVDISDPDGKLYEWTEQNTKLLEQVGLWCEVKDDQRRVHYQTFPPKSGKRFFSP
jgi:uncharacterized protein YcbK (DUF882 family)